MKIKYVVSACLTGELCKYDGNSNFNERVASLVHDGFGKVVCPEVLGGLPIPRIPCEIQGDKVINKDGEDKTTEYVNGAMTVLELCNKYGIKNAILKEKSPSCGKNQVYDGTFTGTVIEGSGVTAALLKENGIKVYSEKDEPIYDAIIVAAGSSSRCKLPYNKMFHYNKTETMIEKTLFNFVGDYMCNKVYLVCKKEEQALFEALLHSNKIEYVEGGSCREESVYNALKLVKSKYVLIHDGARPYVSETLVDSTLEGLEKFDAVVPFVTNGTEHDYQTNGMFIQTPQGFKTEVIKQKFLENIGRLSDFRDESSMFENQKDIHFINGDVKNTKITVYEDIKEFEKGE